MAELVTLGVVGKGYCGNCEAPATVGHLVVKGWEHEAPICAGCLEKLIKRLEARAENQVTEEPKGKK